MSAQNHETDLQPVAAVIVLAAGEATQMKSEKSKLLHELGGKSMLSFALSAASALNPKHLVVVVGHNRQQVIEHLEGMPHTITTAIQPEQLGTGHAVECGLHGLGELSGEVVVTYGDVPMLTGETLRKLVQAHREQLNKITVLSARIPDPTGYGRIVRNGDTVSRIVEHNDASDAELGINEINSGIYVFDADTLQRGLAAFDPNSAQAQMNLTEVITVANREGQRVGAMTIDDVWQTEGINDRIQLARMGRELNRRILDRWMLAGVTIIDPSSTWIDIDVDLASDVTLEPGTILQGATSVGMGATIGPDTTLKDVEVGAHASVVRSHGSFAVIGEGASVGPFSYLRPGTELGSSGKIGAFVETKNAVIAAQAKVPHLSYVGDAVIDQGANIGAGTIFANYDGITKCSSHVGKNVFVGSNSVLIAPVELGDGSFVAAGSAVTDDVSPGALAIARGQQRNIEGWIANRRPGSKWDVAAQQARNEKED